MENRMENISEFFISEFSNWPYSQNRFGFLTNERIEQIAIGNKEIISLIRQLNPNKASGSDGISPHMLLLCDESVVLPLKIIF